MNTPNKITIARICLIPLVAFFYLATFIPWNTFIAGCIFLVAALTDFFDGYLARKHNQVTDLGKFLDTIADKMLVMTALVLVVAFPVVHGSDGVSVFSIVKPNWLGIICAILILAREFAISALRQVAASKGQVLAAEQSGKVKAAFQFVTIGLYFFYAFYAVEFYVQDVRAHTIANTIVGVTLITMLVISTLLTIYSGCEYLFRHSDVFSQQKVAEKVEEAPVVNPMIAKQEKAPAKRTNQASTKAKKPATKAKTAKKAPAKKQMANLDSRGRPIDSLIPRALEMFWEKGWASTTMLQKHLGVGYPRASKIVDQMEELGLISSGDGLKSREILVTKEEYQNRNNK